MKSLEYPSALSTLSYNEWSSIMSPVLQVALPKAGVCRPRVIAYAPLKFQGLGVPHPFAMQLYQHLEMLLQHPINCTKTGSYLQALFESHQLETGTSCGLLQQEYSNTAILASETWLKRIWFHLQEHHIYVDSGLTCWYQLTGGRVTHFWWNFSLVFKLIRMICSG